MFYEEVLKPFLDSSKLNYYQNAFCINDVFYTYGQFRECISKIRYKLKSTNYLNSKVGLVVNDDLETYASIFALWLEGNAYVGLNPKWPSERCEDIIQQVELDLILDSSAQSKYSSINVICTSSLQYNGDFLSYDDTAPDNQLAYIMFTSGSTGKPKGVPISRLNLASFVNAFWGTGINLTSADRCLQCSDLTFDLSVQGYLFPLLKGACCYTVPYGQVKYLYISRLIEDYKLTLVLMAPSVLRYLMPYFDELDFSSLRYCGLAAEACPIDLLEEWYKYAKNVEIYDFYGPTEATVHCSCYKLSRNGQNKSLNGNISIGRPFKGITEVIVDEECKIVPDGEEGELCISGNQVTQGYWNNPSANSKAFFILNIGDERKIFYRTGDLCYKDTDGDFLYSGRKDNQVKIQGFRVEMGEIEYSARLFLNGANVVCVPFSDNHNLTEIAMFIESSPINYERLLNYLRSKLPSYMIPTKVMFLSAFPLNVNDKVDRKELKRLAL